MRIQGVFSLFRRVYKAASEATPITIEINFGHTHRFVPATKSMEPKGVPIPIGILVCGLKDHILMFTSDKGKCKKEK